VDDLLNACMQQNIKPTVKAIKLFHKCMYSVEKTDMDLDLDSDKILDALRGLIYYCNDVLMETWGEFCWI